MIVGCVVTGQGEKQMEDPVKTNSAIDRSTSTNISRRSVMVALGAVTTAAGVLAVSGEAKAGGSIGSTKSTTAQSSPEQVVLAWNDAYLKHDVAGCLAYMSPDFQRIGDSTLWLPMDEAAAAYTWTQFFAAFPNWTWKMTSITTNGNLVICEFTESGTWTKPYTIEPGVTLQPTNTSFTDHDADFFTVKNGLITEIRAYITNNFERTYHIGTVCSGDTV